LLKEKKETSEALKEVYQNVKNDRNHDKIEMLESVKNSSTDLRSTINMVISKLATETHE
jgi:hypothetical protein